MTAEHDPGNVASAGARAFPVAARRLALEALVPVAIALLYAAILYRVWDISWNIPIYEDRSDARQGVALFKGIDENGWWLHNPSLNWPFGQNYHDFPLGGETLQMVLAKVGMWVLSPSATLNVYYMLGFGWVALVTFLVVPPPALRLRDRDRGRAGLHVPPVPLRPRAVAHPPLDLLDRPARASWS